MPMIPLTDEERELFDRLFASPYANVGLMRATFGDLEVAVIMAANPVPDDDDEAVDISPIAVLVTEAVFDRLKPGGEDEGIEHVEIIKNGEVVG